MKVSVIIPTYNRAASVVEAIDSVLNQTMQDFELIVINDGSTDDTETKLEPYMDKIVYLKTENQGMAGARNHGMLLARGEHIAYLDDDDLYQPYKLEIQLAILEQHPEISLVYSEFSGFDNDGYFDEWHLKTYHSSAYRRGRLTYNTIFENKRKLKSYPDISNVLSKQPADWLEHSVYFGNIYDYYLMNTIVFTNSIMFRRSILSNVGLQERYFGFFHDLEFVLRICKDYAVGFIDIPTYSLRYHAEQVTATQGPRSTQNAIKKQRNLLHVTKQYALSDTEYYQSHKDIVDNQMAMLYRAIALPLIGYKSENNHKTKYYPKRARAYLVKCKQYKKPQYFLFALSFMPHILRRIGFKILDVQRHLKYSRLK